MTLAKTTLILAISIVFIPVGADAEKFIPNYSETLDFILQKTGTKHNYSNSIFYQKMVEVDKCIFNLHEDNYTDGNQSEIKDRTTYTFDLRNFDPSRVIIRNNLDKVVLFGFDNKEVVEVNYINFDHPRGKYKTQYEMCREDKWEGYRISKNKCYSENGEFQNSVSIGTFDNQRNMPKLAKALTHMIKICGGKEELF